MMNTNTEPGFRRLPVGAYWNGDKRDMWRYLARLRRRTGRTTTALRMMESNVMPSPPGRPLAMLARAEAAIR